MFDFPRTERLESTDGGLAGAGLATSTLTPTPAAGTLTRSERKLLTEFANSKPERGATAPSAEVESGDFRAVTIRGRVLASDSGLPLAHARLEVWRTYPTAGGDQRTKVTTDEFGYYEFETAHPFQGKVGKDVWRAAHQLFMVGAKGHKTLVTQLFFQGDPLEEHDFLFRRDLALPVEKLCVDGTPLEVVNFDIVLEPGTGINQVCGGEVV
jgi:protocatechuate 3,4-dioxygenase beta subunit